MLKRTTMAALAVAIVAAFAVPGVASAGVWKHHGQAIQENRQLDLTGQTKFSGGLGSIDCQITAQMTLIAGTGTANITKWEPDLDQAGSTLTTKCVAGGFLAACQYHQMVSTELPWIAHNETTRLEITSRTIDFSLSGRFCPAKTGKVTPVNAALGHTLTATPNQPHTFSSFVLSGQVLVHLYSSHVAGQAPFRSETTTKSGILNVVDTGVGSQSRPNTYSLT